MPGLKEVVSVASWINVTSAYQRACKILGTLQGTPTLRGSFQLAKFETLPRAAGFFLLFFLSYFATAVPSLSAPSEPGSAKIVMPQLYSILLEGDDFQDNYKTHGLNFGPYTEAGQNPSHGTVIPDEQIKTLLGIVAPYTRWVRTFGTTHGLENVGPEAHKMGLKTAVGAWLSGNSKDNEEQINSLIKIAKAGGADLLIVGSEVLLRKDLTQEQLIAYIEQVKKEVPGIPVTTADVYSELLAHPGVMDAVDLIFVNYYPAWEGISVNYAVAHVHQKHRQMLDEAKGKPVIVSETGWPSLGDQRGEAVPSPQNAAFYFLNFVSWARANNVAYFYFEAFDEPWKTEDSWGPHWGVWDSTGNMKPGMKAVFDGETIPDNWSNNQIPGGPGDPVIEFTYVPPIGSSDNLRGQIFHVRPVDHGVAVYIKVRGKWWTKPYWNDPVTVIFPDGSWVCDITTGWVDPEATEVTAYLIPGHYQPPLMSGETSLPAELEANALAWVSALR